MKKPISELPIDQIVFQKLKEKIIVVFRLEL